MTDLLENARQAALQGALAILDTPHGRVDYKSDDSPVTLADNNSHDAIVKVLEPTGIPIVSEEGDTQMPKERRYWLVDPLDGTREYIHHRPHYTVNISLMADGVPVLGVISIPESEKVYSGDGTSTFVNYFNEDPTLLQPDNSGLFTVAVSKSHLSGATLQYARQAAGSGSEIRTIRAGSAVKFCMVADGRATIYPRFAPCMEWDIAAGHVILKGVGKNITDLRTGEEMRYEKSGWLNGPFVAR